MSWPEAIVSAVALSCFTVIVAFVLRQASGVIRALAMRKRESRYEELLDEVLAGQERTKSQLDDIQATVAETERRIREVD